MDLRFWAATDTGKTRDHNEDNFLVDKQLNLFVVCDGMGGHAAGEVASAVAVRAVREVIANNRGVVTRHSESPDDPGTRKQVLQLLEYAVQEACTRIYDMAQANPERRGMGTTCSLMMLMDGRSFIAHVGDSRIYLVRKNKVHQLTEDHSLENEMKRQGRLDETSGLAASYKNAITRAVGVYESVEVDTLDFDNLPGDRLLLCSDGLSMYLDDEGIVGFLGRKELEPTAQDQLKRITDSLIQFANNKGGKDNITAVLIEVGEDVSGESEAVRVTMETVRRIGLFHYLSYKELVRIVNVTEQRAVKAGEKITVENESGDELYIIVAGDFSVQADGEPITTLSAGCHFGEMAMIDDRPRSATVSAATDGRLLVIRRPDFYRLLRKDSTLAVKLLWNFIQTLSARLRGTLPPLASPIEFEPLSDAAMKRAMTARLTADTGPVPVQGSAEAAPTSPPPLPRRSNRHKMLQSSALETSPNRLAGISTAIATDVTLPEIQLNEKERASLKADFDKVMDTQRNETDVEMATQEMSATLREVDE